MNAPIPPDLAQRRASISRKTAETEITVEVNLDGSGRADLATGVPFLDHMLDQVARHGLVDLTVRAKGDLHIDAHHTVEDVGICLGKALAQALGNKAGIRRYGSATLPMDEALVTAAMGGRLRRTASSPGISTNLTASTSLTRPRPAA